MGEPTRENLARVRRALAAAIDVVDEALADRPQRKRPAKQEAAGDAREHRIKALLTEFDVLWAKRYGEPYRRTNNGAEAKAAKLIAADPPEKVTHWLQRYFASTRPFVVERRHPFILFAQTINEYRVGRADAVPTSGVPVPSARETAEYLKQLRGDGRS